MLKEKIKTFLNGTPVEPIARRTAHQVKQWFPSQFMSGDYWESRYVNEGNSGAGSYGRLAQYKAEVLNDFVAKHKVSSVIEFGSGDGNQLTLATYPSYIGVDVSQTAVSLCRTRFADDATMSFKTVSEYAGQKADLSLSLDVIYHLIEDTVFKSYMISLFDAAERFVIIYSSNKDEQVLAPHVRHRKFSDWIDENRDDFRLRTHIPNRYPLDLDDPENTSFADFYIYEKLS